MCPWLLAIIALLYLRALKLMEIGLQTKCGDAVRNSEALPDVPVLSIALFCCCSHWYLRGEKSVKQLYLQLCIPSNKITEFLGQ